MRSNDEMAVWFQRLVAFIVGVKALLLLISVRGEDEGEVLYTVIPALLLAVAGARLMRVRVKDSDLVAFAIAACVALVPALRAGQVDADSYFTPGSTLYAAHAVMISLVPAAVVTRTSRPAKAAALGLCLVYLLIIAALTASLPLMLQVAGLFVGVGVGLGVFSFALNRALGRADEAAHDAAEAARLRADRDSRAAAEKQAHLLIHDQLLGSLAAIKLAPRSEHSRQIADEALRRLLEAPPSVDERQLSGLTHPAGTGVDPRVIDRRAVDHRIPRRVWTAVCDATSEALRNVQQHANANHVVIEVEGDADWISVTITDDGDGFDVEQSHGFGTSMSIRDRMASVGGSASIESMTSVGTSVGLRWNRATDTGPLNERWRELHAAVGGANVLTWAVPVVHSIAVAPAILNHLGPNPGLNVVYLIGLLTLLGVFLHRLTRGPFSRRLEWTSVVTVAALTALGIALAGPNALGTYAAWSIDLLSATFLVPIALYGRRSAVATAVVSMVVIVMAFALLDPSEDPAEAFGLAAVPVLYGGAFWLMSTAIVRVGRRMTESHEERMLTILDEAHTVQRDDILRTRLRGLEDETRAVLLEVADPRGALDEPTIAWQADRLALMLRDELLAPGLIDDDARLSIDRLRTAGSTLSIRPGIDPTAAPTVRVLLRRLAELDDGPTSVVLSSPVDAPGHIVMTISPAVSTVVFDDLDEVRVEFDSEATIVRSRA